MDIKDPGDSDDYNGTTTMGGISEGKSDAMHSNCPPHYLPLIILMKSRSL